MIRQRVIVYVDGFNFYYGLKHKEWRKFYWLNIVELFEQFMRPNQELIAVKYFSARPLEMEKSKRQDAFFMANKENPKFQLILGKYLNKRIKCFRCGKNINTFEEKESDVRIATQMIADAYQNICDVSIIVSADSDMLPAIELTAKKGNLVYVYFPPNQYSNNLALASHVTPVVMKQYKTRFKKALFSEVVSLSKTNYQLAIPAKWKAHQNWS